jgi:hypothetical protein
MNHSATTRWLSNRWWIDVLAWSAILWIAAGLLHRSPLHSADWNARPLWWHVLIGQAFPWVLQFVAVSIPVLCVARWKLRRNHSWRILAGAGRGACLDVADGGARGHRAVTHVTPPPTSRRWKLGLCTNTGMLAPLRPRPARPGGAKDLAQDRNERLALRSQGV